MCRARDKESNYIQNISKRHSHQKVRNHRVEDVPRTVVAEHSVSNVMCNMKLHSMAYSMYIKEDYNHLMISFRSDNEYTEDLSYHNIYSKRASKTSEDRTWIMKIYAGITLSRWPKHGVKETRLYWPYVDPMKTPTVLPPFIWISATCIDIGQNAWMVRTWSHVRVSTNPSKYSLWNALTKVIPSK